MHFDSLILFILSYLINTFFFQTLFLLAYIYIYLQVRNHYQSLLTMYDFNVKEKEEILKAIGSLRTFTVFICIFLASNVYAGVISYLKVRCGYKFTAIIPHTIFEYIMLIGIFKSMQRAIDVTDGSLTPFMNKSRRQVTNHKHPLLKSLSSNQFPVMGYTRVSGSLLEPYQMKTWEKVPMMYSMGN